MPTPRPRRRAPVPLREWAAPEEQGKLVTRGETLSLLESFRQRLRDDAWYRRLWRYLTSAAGE